MVNGGAIFLINMHLEGHLGGGATRTGSSSRNPVNTLQVTLPLSTEPKSGKTVEYKLPQEKLGP